MATLKSNIGQSLLSADKTNLDLGKNMARTWVITTMPKLPEKLRAEVITYIVMAGLAIDEQKKPLETMQALHTAGVLFHPTAFVESPSLPIGDTADYAFINRESLEKLYSGRSM